MKRRPTVAKDLREKLKVQVDALGRQAVAEALDFRYQTLSSKLDGRSPLTEDDYEKLSSFCDAGSPKK